MTSNVLVKLMQHLSVEKFLFTRSFAVLLSRFQLCCLKSSHAEGILTIQVSSVIFMRGADLTLFVTREHLLPYERNSQPILAGNGDR